MTWRIAKEVEVHWRAKFNSPNNLFAWLDFCLVPSKQQLGIEVTTNWLDASDDRWLPAIKSGVERFLAGRTEFQKPVGFTRIEMLRVIAHPEVTNDRAVRFNVFSALHDEFEEHGVSVDD